MQWFSSCPTPPKLQSLTRCCRVCNTKPTPTTMLPTLRVSLPSSSERLHQYLSTKRAPSSIHSVCISRPRSKPCPPGTTEYSMGASGWAIRTSCMSSSVACLETYDRITVSHRTTRILTILIQPYSNVQSDRLSLEKSRWAVPISPRASAF